MSWYIQLDTFCQSSRFTLCASFHLTIRPRALESNSTTCTYQRQRAWFFDDTPQLSFSESELEMKPRLFIRCRIALCGWRRVVNAWKCCEQKEEEKKRSIELGLIFSPTAYCTCVHKRERDCSEEYVQLVHTRRWVHTQTKKRKRSSVIVSTSVFRVSDFTLSPFWISFHSSASFGRTPWISS